MRSLLYLSALFFISLAVSAIALAYTDLGRLPWAVSRASGIVVFLLLTVSIVFGLGMSTRLAHRIIPKAMLYEIHSFVSVLTLLFVLVHAGFLLFDGYIAFGAQDILVPFASSYRPFATGLGVISAWVLGAVTLSSWLRPRLSYRMWRRLHYLSFAVWGAGLAHGVLTGTDTANPVVAQLYWSSAAAVAGLVTYRILFALAARNRLANTATRAGAQPNPRATPATG